MSTRLLERARLLALADSPSAGTIAYDFDGVLHDQTDGWREGAVYGPSIPGAVEELQLRVAGGWSAVIMTARHPQRRCVWALSRRSTPGERRNGTS